MSAIINGKLLEGKALVDAIIHEIEAGYFDEAVLDRMHNDNNLIDRFCDDCDQKCKDTCEGRRYRI